MDRQSDGFHICVDQNYLEKAKKGSTELFLIASGDDTEIMKLKIVADRRFSLSVKQGFEALYVIEGKIKSMDRGEDRLISKGDCISAHNMESPAIFSTLTDVEMLYVSSRPVFYYLSEEVNELLELARLIEEKDGYTAEHCKRIQELSLKTGEKLGLGAKRLEILTNAAYLHDVGKAGIPDSILDKKGKLTNEEWEIMKKHPSIGKEMVAGTVIKEAGFIVEQHHERIDGSGYPYGLKGDNVIIEAQIVGVVDIYDAMTTDRPYRKALSEQTALEELRSIRGKQISEKVIDAFFDVIGKSVH